MFQLQEAEARGDAAEGLGITDAFQFGPDGKPFWSIERCTELYLIAQWGPVLPGWAWSRWVCNQAARAMHEELRDPSLDAERVPGCTPRPTRSGPTASSVSTTTVCSGSSYAGWPGRRCWLEPTRSRRGRGRRWAASSSSKPNPMSITWLDLTERRKFSTPTSAAPSLFLPGDQVIGRLVPTEAGRMFESRPLGVPPGVAQPVAEAPTRWSELLRAARPGGDHGLLHDPRPRESMVTDVLPRVLRLAVPCSAVRRRAAARAVLDSVAASWPARSVPARDVPIRGPAWAPRCSSRTSRRRCRTSSSPLTAPASRAEPRPRRTGRHHLSSGGGAAVRRRLTHSTDVGRGAGDCRRRCSRIERMFELGSGAVPTVDDVRGDGAALSRIGEGSTTPSGST